MTAISFLVTASLGKHSYGRQRRDNVRMQSLYSVTLAKLDEHDAHFNQFMIALAREELIENGIWLSYMTENDLE